MLTCMLQVNKDKSHVNVNKLHVKKIMLHVDLIHLVTKKKSEIYHHIKMYMMISAVSLLFMERLWTIRVRSQVAVDLSRENR